MRLRIAEGRVMVVTDVGERRVLLPVFLRFWGMG